MRDFDEIDAESVADRLVREWREGGREQHEAEMAARQRQIDRERIDAELRAEAEARATNDTQNGRRRNISPVRHTEAAMTRAWSDYIDRRIKQEARATEDAMSAAIREALDKRQDVQRDAIARFVVDRLKEKLHGELKALRGEMRDELATLRGEMRDELATLRRDFDALRYKRDRAALDIIEERIEQLEENSGERRLKLIG